MSKANEDQLTSDDSGHGTMLKIASPMHTEKLVCIQGSCTVVVTRDASYVPAELVDDVFEAAKQHGITLSKEED